MSCWGRRVEFRVMNIPNEATSFIFTVAIMVLSSCGNKPKTSSPYSYRDSIMRDYFSLIDSLPDEDTLSRDFHLLKAYYKNDTSSLREFHTNLLNSLHYVQQRPTNERCNTSLLINVMDFPEGYRFGYSRAFCNKWVVITVSKIENGMVIQSILYEEVYETKECKILSQISKKFDNKAWDLFEQKVNYVDFWNLNVSNQSGADGSSLTIDGYRRYGGSKDYKYKSVYRWSSEDMAVGELFKHVLDLSDIKVDCFKFEENK